MICPNCFNEVTTSTCPHCGYTYDREGRDPDILAPGTVLNGIYTIGRCLGRGGFGITYSAYDKIEGAKCAIKEYYPGDIVERGTNDELIVDEEKTRLYKNGQKSFIEDAKSLSRLKENKNVVTYKNYFEANNTAYLVEEFLDGVNLKRFIAMHCSNGKMDLNNALTIITTISATLIDVHSKDILHRDITPENIFITSEGYIKLIDFGSARNYMRNNAEGMSVYIKPGYAPIEQYRSDGNQGPWSDIYSLAATFYYIVSGVSIKPAKERIHSDRTVPLHQLCSDVNPQLSAVIHKALSNNASDRQQSVERFLKEINEATGEKPAPQQPQPKTPQPLQNALPCIKIIGGPKASVSTATGSTYTDKIFLQPGINYTLGRVPRQNNISIDGNNNLSRAPHCYIKYNGSDKCFEIVDCSSSGTFEYTKTRIVKGKTYKYPVGTKLYLGDRFQTLIELTLQVGGGK